METARRVTDEQGHQAMQMSIESYHALELAMRVLVDFLHTLDQEQYEVFVRNFENTVRGRNESEEAEEILDVLENLEAEAAIMRDRGDEEDFIDWRTFKSELNYG